MANECHRLGSSDHPECIDFLTRAFGAEMPFDQISPANYQPTPEHMGCIRAIRRGGRIIATAGLFPIRLRGPKGDLDVAGIGAVAVDPACRGQGLMSHLMTMLRAEIAERGFPISYLGGQRQRYRHWGWERCGTMYRFLIGPAGVSGEAVASSGSGLTVEEVTSGMSAETVESIRQLHCHSGVHCARDRSAFEAYLRYRRATVLVARANGGRCRGYLSMDGARGELHEIVTMDERALHALIEAALRRCPRDSQLVAVVSPYASPSTVLSLGRIAEASEITHGGNWLVLDWVKTIRFLLTVQQRSRTLTPGQVTIGFDDTAAGIEITVGKQEIRCRRSEARPAIVAGACTMARVLFGPLPPSSAIPLPASAAILDAWCPLPLGLGRLDRV